MPQNGGSSNGRQSNTQASKELNARVPEYLPGQALPFTALTPINVGTPALVSYIQQHFSHIGESSSRLTTLVIDRFGLASNASRDIHPSLA